ncbi:MAG: hypothetical protein JW969_00595 [Spirochaetales bacterium]|nr:hypothetical protein [Spirochaetales bacterium]
MARIPNLFFIPNKNSPRNWKIGVLVNAATCLILAFIFTLLFDMNEPVHLASAAGLGAGTFLYLVIYIQLVKKKVKIYQWLFNADSAFFLVFLGLVGGHGYILMDRTPLIGILLGGGGIALAIYMAFQIVFLRQFLQTEYTVNPDGTDHKEKYKVMEQKVLEEEEKKEKLRGRMSIAADGDGKLSVAGQKKKKKK